MNLEVIEGKIEVLKQKYPTADSQYLAKATLFAKSFWKIGQIKQNE